MSKKKSTGRPKLARGVKSNMVAAAVELAGGVTAVARLCGVARQSVYSWIEEWRVERLIDALKLGALRASRSSGWPETRSSRKAFRPQNRRPYLTNQTTTLNRIDVPGCTLPSSCVDDTLITTTQER